jgi:HEAT repeat protein
MRLYIGVCAALLSLTPSFAQSVKPKDVRDIAKDGAASIPRLANLLKNTDRAVRLEAVKQIVDIGTQISIDPLLQATGDNDPEIQSRAAAGLVNFYYPGYVESGVIASLKKTAASVVGRFGAGDTEVIDSYVVVRDDAIAALGKLAVGGASVETRAGAAHALGVLRGKAAVPQLVEAAHSKDSNVIYESLVALQKIRDTSAGPGVEFRLRDLDQRVQIEAIETVGLLRDQSALPALVEVFKQTDKVNIRRAALTSIAMLPDPSSRVLFAQNLGGKDDDLRAAAAEGLGRLRDPQDVLILDQAFKAEGRPSPRLSLAFALVLDGKTELGQFGPLQYLVDTLNSSAHKGEALPLLVELAREEKVRMNLYTALAKATKDEKIGLAQVLGRSGDAGSVFHLRKLSEDKDADVAQEGLRALRAVQARL